MLVTDEPINTEGIPTQSAKAPTPIVVTLLPMTNGVLIPAQLSNALSPMLETDEPIDKEGIALQEKNAPDPIVTTLLPMIKEVLIPVQSMKARIPMTVTAVPNVTDVMSTQPWYRLSGTTVSLTKMAPDGHCDAVGVCSVVGVHVRQLQTTSPAKHSLVCE